MALLCVHKRNVRLFHCKGNKFLNVSLEIRNGLMHVREKMNARFIARKNTFLNVSLEIRNGPAYVHRKVLEYKLCCKKLNCH